MEMRTLLNADQLDALTGFCRTVDKAGKMEIVHEPTAVMRWANLAQIALLLDMDLSDNQTALLVFGLQDMCDDKTGLESLATAAHAYINQLLPVGYWLIPNKKGYVITKTATIAVPKDAREVSRQPTAATA